MHLDKKKSILVIALLLLFGIGLAVIDGRFWKLDWAGRYTGSFYTYGVYAQDDYKCFMPTIEIEDAGQHYVVTISLKTRTGLTNGTGGQVFEEAFQPVELDKKAGKRYIFEAEGRYSDFDAKVYVELQYDTGERIRFRYAESESQLKAQEFYTLERVAEEH
ncbi:MAG: hypothetical protein IJY09_09275 [Lachnospiraceae bacterium]|nr:hypothetical protein [Lachnospiraceae bacterium]